MDQQQRRHRLLAGLLHLPTLERIARSLVLDYLAIFKPIQATIYRLNQDDSITCLAAYGVDNATVGAVITSSGWRNDSEATSQAMKATMTNAISWSDENRRAVINLYVQSILIGFMVLRFANSVLYVEEFGDETLEISWYVSLYMTVHALTPRNADDGEVVTDRQAKNEGKERITRLSERQKLVLTGISEGKTNNLIAKELGYSVSTIRHETMRIFEVLSVSNRVEAASYTTTLGLI